MKEPKVIEQFNKEKIKQYKKQLRSKKFDLDNELLFSESGNAIIQCNVEKTKSIFSNFDPVQDRALNQNFHNFLMDETEIIPIRYDLQLNLIVDEDFTKENEIQVKKAIKRHYSFEITKDKVIEKKTLKKCLLLLLFGFIGLCLLPLFRSIQTNMPIYESILILTWFFIWEAVSTKVYDSSEIKMHKINMLRLYNAEIVFVKKSEKIVKQDTINISQQNSTNENISNQSKTNN